MGKPYTQLEHGLDGWALDCNTASLTAETLGVMALILAASTANAGGLYRISIPRLMAAGRLPRTKVDAALAVLTRLDVLAFDADESVVWVRDMARRHVGGPTDNRVKAIWRHLSDYTDTSLWPAFWEHNRAVLALDESGLPVPKPSPKVTGKALRGSRKSLPPSSWNGATFAQKVDWVTGSGAAPPEAVPFRIAADRAMDAYLDIVLGVSGAEPAPGAAMVIPRAVVWWVERCAVSPAEAADDVVRVIRSAGGRLPFGPEVVAFHEIDAACRVLLQKQSESRQLVTVNG